MARRMARQLASGKDPNGKYDEARSFAAMHTCAYRASRRARSKPIASADRRKWVRRWRVIRDFLVERNVGLVYSTMGRLGLRGVEHDELRSEALFALIRSVDGYNPWKGFRFSTYACHAIVRSMIQIARKTSRYRRRFYVQHDLWPEDITQTDNQAELYAERLNRVLDGNLGELTERETNVLGRRYPLDGRHAQTLGEVGDWIGLSRERVRQIEKVALGKIRQVLEADPVLR